MNSWESDGRQPLRQQLTEGVRRMRLGECDVITMDCLDKPEMEACKAWMEEHYPDVTVYWSWPRDRERASTS